MKPHLLACLFLLFLSSSSASEKGSSSDFFTTANLAYSEGRYAEAVDDYQKLADREGFSAPLLFNLGTAAFLDGQHGTAILALERALLLSPGDPDTRANLAAARRESGAYEEKRTLLQKFFETLSPNTWTGVASTCLFLLGAVVLSRSLRVGFRQLTWGRQKILIVVSICLFVLGATAVLYNQRDLHAAIVLQEQAPLRLSPFEDSETAATLKAGKTVHIKKEHRGFYYVRTATGILGWLHETETQPIIP